MKKLFEDIRRQNKPDLSLDRQILERAKTMRAGKKEILSEKGKEHIEMKVSMNKAESTETAIVKKNHGALIAAAAAFVLVIGGTAAAALKGSMPIEKVSESAASSVSESSVESSSLNEPAVIRTPAVTPVSDSSAAPTDEVTVETLQVTTVTKTNEEPMPPSTDPVAGWAKPFLARNSDMVGNIHIPGFDNDYEVIDFPVVQRSGIGWQYYLDHDFSGDEYRRGTLVAPDVNGRNTISPEGQPRNTVIYGYNAFDEFPETDEIYDEKNRGLMFTGLTRYQLGIDFYREHALIDYKTIYGDDGEYVIFAVFNHEGGEEQIFTANAFGYEEHGFDEWLAAVREHSFYECDINCTADDKYLTLITPVHPEYDTDYYRTVIAKKLTPQDDKQAIINSVKMKSTDSDENSQEDTLDIKETRLPIPIPSEATGTYVFDIYVDGTLSYTKTVTDAEALDVNFTYFDISMNVAEVKSENLAVYVKSMDLGEENYVYYGDCTISYDENAGFSLDSRFDEEAILSITPDE